MLYNTWVCTDQKRKKPNFIITTLVKSQLFSEAKPAGELSTVAAPQSLQIRDERVWQKNDGQSWEGDPRSFQLNSITSFHQTQAILVMQYIVMQYCNPVYCARCAHVQSHRQKVGTLTHLTCSLGILSTDMSLFTITEKLDI